MVSQMSVRKCALAIAMVYVGSSARIARSDRSIAANVTGSNSWSPTSIWSAKSVSLWHSEWLADKDTDDVKQRIARCLDPDAPDLDVLDQDSIKSNILGAAKAGRDHNLHGTLLSTPIDMTIAMVQVGAKFPHLLANQAGSDPSPVPKTSLNPYGWKDSECFKFDYDSAPSDVADSYGCRAFEKSFKPLKELRNCIVEKLSNDAQWKAHRTPEFKEFCENSFPDCEDYDTMRRAEEIIKTVSFKELPQDPTEVLKLITRKANTSRVIGNKKINGASIEESTAQEIASECFLYDASADGTLQSTRRVHKISGCLPMMYDVVEWGALGVFNGIVKYNEPDHSNNDSPTVVTQHNNVPPVCSRLATSMIAWEFDHAKFSIGNLYKNAMRSWTWADCRNPKAGNCRKFGTCWERALDEACKATSFCCASSHH